MYRESADQEMLKFLAQETEAVYDLWVGEALAEAMKVAGDDPDNGAEVEAFQQGELHPATISDPLLTRYSFARGAVR